MSHKELANISPPMFHPDNIRKKFVALYGYEPLMIRSPGRINLIGEHTDYNDGFVMPAAINRGIVYAVGVNDSSEAFLHSLRHNETIRFDPADPVRVASPLWANYLLGVVRSFVNRGYVLRPIQCVVDGDVPTGAGLSSSAALECGFAFALNVLHDLDIPRIEMVHMALWAEHHYAGVKCGIMDQFASMMSHAGQAVVLDCRSLSYEYFTLDLQEYTIVLCDTLVKHSLADSAYNTRREECEAGVEILKQHYPAVHSLRDVTSEMLDKHKTEFGSKVFDRCVFVVEENARVISASAHLAQRDLPAFGRKMFESHEGLSLRYEVSCEELDYLVDAARNHEGVLGSRMMGGGFGGCTINLVNKLTVTGFVSTLREAYQNRFGRDMDHYIVSLAEGTSLLDEVAIKVYDQT